MTQTQFPVVENQFFQTTGKSPVKLHYARCGMADKPLMLFVHGFPQAWFAWEDMMRRFSADYFCVALDLRGFNKSSKPSGVAHYHAKHVVDDVLQLAEYLVGQTPFTLVAHDWGGAAAWNLAIKYPQRLRQLVCINSPHPVPFGRGLSNDPVQQTASAYMNWLRKPGSEAALAKDNFALMQGFFNGMGQGVSSWFDGEKNAATRDRYIAAWSTPSEAKEDNEHSLTGSVNYYRATPLHPPTKTEKGAAAFEWKVADWQVNVRTLLVWGEKDLALPKTLLDEMPACVPDLTLHRIPNGSHWVIHEFPDEISQAMKSFLQ